MYQPLIDSLIGQPKTVVITATQRLAQHLQQRFAQQQMQTGCSAWIAPTIMPLGSWYQLCYETAMDRGLLCEHLLSPLQQQCLWEDIINQHAQSQQLLRQQATATLAQQAWGLIQQWQLPFSESLFSSNVDTQTFYRWATVFKQHCQQHGQLDRDRLVLRLLNLWQEEKLPVPTQLIITGFDELPPIFASVLATLTKRGTKHHEFHPIVKSSQISCLPCNDNEQEIVTMVRWAGQQLLQSPDVSIGCVVPNLTALRSQLDYHFTTIFPQLGLSPEQFNLTGGQSLASFPITQILDILLTAKDSPLTMTQFSQILRSPFIRGGESEMTARAQLDQWLRAKNQQAITLIQVRDLLNQDGMLRQRLPVLNSVLSQLISSEASLTQQLSIRDWVTRFTTLLTIWGWPGERPLSSEEFQIVNRWQALLTEFIQLEYLYDAIRGEHALQKLLVLLNETQFQIKTPPARVQVFGCLETAGLTFDALWVMDLHAEQWPPAAQPNPFIPNQIQQRQQTPHSSATRELNYCKQLTQRFTQSAGHVIFSYPQHDGEQIRQPSALIDTFPVISEASLALTTLTVPHHATLGSAIVEYIPDFIGPPLNLAETAVGGSFIFKLQAACPFRAFAELRLNARNLPPRQLGFNAMERGTIVHRVLEQLWTNLKSQAQLSTLTNEEKNQLLAETIALILQQSAASNPAVQTRYLQIEQQRLEKLLTRWLALEQQRQPFTVIACEMQQEVTVNGLPIKLQIDRMDQLANGECLIIDYKTGKPSVQHWFGDRPEEPQLPLYLISQENAATGIFYGQVRADDMKFTGICQTSIEEASFKIDKTFAAADWQTCQEDWRHCFDALSLSYQQGYAAVDPKDPIATCQTCQLQSFCRIYAEGENHP